jgi:predicted Zn-dependent protease
MSDKPCSGHAFAFVLALGAAGAAGAATFDFGTILGAGKDLQTATTDIDEKQEIELGRELAGRALGATKTANGGRSALVEDSELQAYVNRVGRWIASHGERPDLPWRFGVTNDPTVNAFAAPGGYILITRGLYEILDNEAQLAGVLGHEIGHVVKRHHVTVMQKTAGASAFAQGVQVVAQARGVRRQDMLNKILGNGAEIFARKLDKDAEFEADQIGVVLAARAGYSPYGLVEVLHKLAARGGSDASLELIFETHPHPNERLEKLGAALEPRIATLPAGKEPAIRQVSGDIAPAPAATPATKRKPAAAAQPDSAPAASPRGGSGIGIDPGGIMKGIFGR